MEGKRRARLSYKSTLFLWETSSLDFCFKKNYVRMSFFNSHRGVGTTGGHKQVDFFVVVVEHSWHSSRFFPLISVCARLCWKAAPTSSAAFDFSLLRLRFSSAPARCTSPGRSLGFVISGSNHRHRHRHPVSPHPAGWNQLMEMGIKSKLPIRRCVAEEGMKLETHLVSAAQTGGTLQV